MLVRSSLTADVPLELASRARRSRRGDRQTTRSPARSRGPGHPAYDGVRRALDLDLGVSHLRGQGLGAGGLERIHDSMRRLERVRPEPGWRPAR
ncbi:hypothetical protein [Streptomyces sp. NPDC056672]|uniref:hypothetical protein n=1 Tax=Streptomyces sp. NPDC056672 TaxID=3345906 RepID=UPI0036C3F1F4